MATPEQRARRAAQRATAKRVRPGAPKYIPVIPRATRAAVMAGRERYGYDVIAGREPYPVKGSAIANNLASLAGKARWGKADPVFERAFSRYWYHKDDEKPSEVDVEDSADHEASDDDNADNQESE